MQILLRDVFPQLGNDVSWEGVEVTSYWSKLGRAAARDGVYHNCLTVVAGRYAFQEASAVRVSHGPGGHNEAGRAASLAIGFAAGVVLCAVVGAIIHRR